MILCVALTLLSVAGKLHAQDGYTPEKEWYEMTRTDRAFHVFKSKVNIRDYVYLKGYNKMMIELNNVDDYDKVKELRSMVAKFLSDMAFYKDSMENGSGNVRIDYALSEGSDRAQIRFKKYPQNGDVYIQKKGVVSRLKLEHDTVVLLVHMPEKKMTQLQRLDKEKNSMLAYRYAIGITFYLERYTDLERLYTDHPDLDKVIDTLKSTKDEGTIVQPAKHPSSTIYKPYGDFVSFKKLRGLIPSDAEAFSWSAINPSDKLTISLNMGVGLVRNTLVPTAEIGISIYNMRQAYYTRSFQSHEINTQATLSMSPYFFFSRGGDGKHYVADNWFANFSIGGATQFLGVTTPLMTAGVGYLLIPKGDIFKGTTMKAFLSVKLRHSVTICPEIISTNNFKQIFPGITLKIF